MDEPLIGEIRLFGGNFAPQGWAFCHGQLLEITQHRPLFAVIGATYGGDGQTTFALPDLRSRVVVHQGQGTGLTRRIQGEVGGAEKLSESQMGDRHAPYGQVLNHGDTEKNKREHKRENKTAVIHSPNATETAEVIATARGTQANTRAEQVPPYLGLNYIIALEGIIPARRVDR
ncbi:tail fiber protein [Alkalinema sp. FACHB-956]|uniref:phage tail protein n=1 Tax=Alkalinema sp. FACHB-956 TaxID=2692768 RepID=UPI001688C9A1|nr:tail fiber protein [Alkalinema sp. FACHB-956]MBD2326557.1 phage tail protein [Alkalinema sp. FACHB-956]